MKLQNTRDKEFFKASKVRVVYKRKGNRMASNFSTIWELENASTLPLKLSENNF